MFVIDVEKITLNRNGVTEKEQRTGWMDLCHEDDEAVKFAPDQSGLLPPDLTQ